MFSEPATPSRLWFTKAGPEFPDKLYVPGIPAENETVMTALVLLLTLVSQPGLAQHNPRLGNGLLLCDTTREGIRAWKEQNQRAWEAMQKDTDDDTLQLVGRWPFGGAFHVRPSWNVANDSIIYMASGSGIRVLKVSNPRRPQMLGQINCRGLLYGGTENGTGFVSRDTFLYVLYGYTCGLQVFSVANPSSPSEVGNLGLSTQPTGIALSDSYAIVVGWDSLLRVINVADPRNMQQVAALLLPDEALGVDIKGSCAFVACGHAGLVSVDISNPLSPQQRGQVAGFTGIWVVCDTTRPLAYVAGGAGGLHIINIADPQSPCRISTLASTPTIDIFKADTFVYLTGSTAYQSNFYVVSIADSAHPRLVGQSLADGWSYSACALMPFSYAYTCDGWEGLHVISLANPTAPVVDTAMWGAWTSLDLAIQDSLVYDASHWAGLKVISVADPSRPGEVGCYDTLNTWDEVQAVAVRDSFAFISWFSLSSGFRSVDVSDPARPRLGGGALCSDFGKAIVVRDTVAFVAEDNSFEVYNIARPREPVRIGRCDLTNVTGDLVVIGDHAYIAPSLEIVNIADPTQPWLASTTSSNSGGLAIVDTFAYCAAYGSLEVYSVANPLTSRRLATVQIPGVGWDVEISGSVAYVGCGELEAFDISDRVNPTMLAHYRTPHYVRKIRSDSPYVYAACSDGGLYIFRSCSTGVTERAFKQRPDGVIQLRPNPTGGAVWVSVGRATPGSIVLSVRDIAGREVQRQYIGGADNGRREPLDVADLPDGCYFVSVVGDSPAYQEKLVISKRR